MKAGTHQRAPAFCFLSLSTLKAILEVKPRRRGMAGLFFCDITQLGVLLAFRHGAGVVFSAPDAVFLHGGEEAGHGGLAVLFEDESRVAAFRQARGQHHGAGVAGQGYGLQVAVGFPQVMPRLAALRQRFQTARAFRDGHGVEQYRRFPGYGSVHLETAAFSGLHTAHVRREQGRVDAVFAKDAAHFRDRSFAHAVGAEQGYAPSLEHLFPGGVQAERRVAEHTLDGAGKLALELIRREVHPQHGRHFLRQRRVDAAEQVDHAFPDVTARNL